MRAQIQSPFGEFEQRTRWTRALIGCTVFAAVFASLFSFGSMRLNAAAAQPATCEQTAANRENIFQFQVPSAGSTVTAGTPIGANYHDETDLLDGSGVPGPVHKLSFTLTGPVAVPLTVSYTRLAAGTGFTDAYGRPWRDIATQQAQRLQGIDTHPDQEWNFVVQITATYSPTGLAVGTYLADLSAFDGDNNNTGGDCGVARWTFTILPPANGTLAGNIVDCTSGTPGSPITSSGTISATGPQSVPAANPLSASVPPGTYTEAATAP